jgi:hypothetical protein
MRDLREILKIDFGIPRAQRPDTEDTEDCPAAYGCTPPRGHTLFLCSSFSFFFLFLVIFLLSSFSLFFLLRAIPLKEGGDEKEKENDKDKDKEERRKS